MRLCRRFNGWHPHYIAAIFILLTPFAARSQGIAAIQSHCYLGGTQAKVSGLSSTNFQQGIIPSCTVTVYLTGTQTLAPIYAAATGTGSVSGVTITAGGNYSVCPTAATFTGTGSGAAGTPVCVNGSVASVTMTAGGNGYSAAPAVGFTGGTGTGAAGTANLATSLSNPFTANAKGSLDAGGWIFWAAVNQGYDIVLSGGISPNTYATPITLTDRFPGFQFSGGNNGGAANISHVQQMLSGDNAGNAVGMPEKGTVLVNGSPNTATVAYDNDIANGHFDCRDTSLAGGCLGGTPGLAMQALRNEIICYQAITGKHANVNFPPGDWLIGTPAAPTLDLPVGAYYRGASSNLNGTATTFQATYNNVLALHFGINLSATCPDGNVHTSSLFSGHYEGFAVHGCSDVGCVNVPGDTGAYPSGGPHQDSMKIEDQAGYHHLLGAIHNGGNGVEVAGEDAHVHTIWGEANMAWYAFGHIQAGQIYDPTIDGIHCNIMLDSQDGTFFGPFETYGWLGTPGAEYGHNCAILWGGGDAALGPVFSNRDQIGIIRPVGQSNGRAIGGRIDAPMGEGIVMKAGGNSLTGIDNSSACSGFATVSRGTVFGPYISSLGSGMTDGSYVVPAAGGFGGTGATLTVVVSGGKASTITVSAPGSGYTSTPSFTMTGTGGLAATIGATTYQHCDYIEDTAGNNSYVNVKNVFEGFFGPDFSTGGIWYFGNPGSTFDRGTPGSFERVVGGLNSTVSQPKGWTAHKDTLDLFSINGGVAITGPAVNFTGGTHFVSTDGSPTSWTGPFTVDNVMQDLWIMGGNPNTTLPASAGWQTCSGHDLNLGVPGTAGIPRWFHFQVFQDDVSHTIGTNFIFKEQCDTTFTDYLQPGFAWLAANSVLPVTDTQATLDAAGSIAVRAYPPLAAMTVTSAGAGSAFQYCYATQVWVAGGKQTTAANCSNTHTPPVSTGPSDNVQVHLAMPQNWTRYKVYLNSTTDPGFTPGVWYDVTAANGLPQPASCDFQGICTAGLLIEKKVPSDTSTIASANLALNMTGTFNACLGCVTVPASSSTLGIKGQVIRDVVGGFDYICDTEDHWKRAAITWNNF